MLESRYTFQYYSYLHINNKIYLLAKDIVRIGHQSFSWCTHNTSHTVTPERLQIRLTFNIEIYLLYIYIYISKNTRILRYWHGHCCLCGIQCHVGRYNQCFYQPTQNIHTCRPSYRCCSIVTPELFIVIRNVTHQPQMVNKYISVRRSFVHCGCVCAV